MLKKIVILMLMPLLSFASEEEYVIDKSHFAVGFLVEHVGYAKTLGMFRDIDGSYSHDVARNMINDINIVIKNKTQKKKFKNGTVYQPSVIFWGFFRFNNTVS